MDRLLLFPFKSHQTKWWSTSRLNAVWIIQNNCLREQMWCAFLSTSPLYFVNWIFSERARVVGFFLFVSLFLKFTNIYCCRFQLSAVEPSRKSPPAESCLLAILLHMSTTCTACGPSRPPLEAPSGLNKHSPFPLFCRLLHFGSHSLFLGTFIFPIHKASAIPPLFFSGIHHLYRLLCNQSLPRLLLANGWVATSWEEIPLKACRFKATSKYLWVNSAFDMYVSPPPLHPQLPFLEFDLARHSVFRSCAGCRFRLFSDHRLRDRMVKYFGRPSFSICCCEAAHLGHGRGGSSGMKCSPAHLSRACRFIFLMIIIWVWASAGAGLEDLLVVVIF